MKRILLLGVLAAAIIGMVVIGGASAGSAATLYGPSGGRFSIAFPSTPTAFNNTPAIRKVASIYGAVYAYTVASPSTPFADKDEAKPPAFWVIVAKPGPGITLTQFENLEKGGNDAKRETIGGPTAYVSIYSESAIQPASQITDKTATVGQLYTHQGTTLYIAVAVAAQASTVHSFLFSFRPAN